MWKSAERENENCQGEKERREKRGEEKCVKTLTVGFHWNYLWLAGASCFASCAICAVSRQLAGLAARIIPRGGTKRGGPGGG